MKAGTSREAIGNSAKPQVFAFALCTLLLALCGSADAQQQGKSARIGFVSSGSASVRIGALRQGLRELGWIEGKNIIIEQRQAEGKLDRIPILAAELVRLKVDVIVWGGGVETAKEIRTVPVVIVGTGSRGHRTRAKPGAARWKHHGTGIPCY